MKWGSFKTKMEVDQKLNEKSHCSPSVNVKRSREVRSDSLDLIVLDDSLSEYGSNVEEPKIVGLNRANVEQSV